MQNIWSCTFDKLTILSIVRQVQLEETVVMGVMVATVVMGRMEVMAMVVRTG